MLFFHDCDLVLLERSVGCSNAAELVRFVQTKAVHVTDDIVGVPTSDFTIICELGKVVAGTFRGEFQPASRTTHVKCGSGPSVSS
jgi:hypothetical protein